jgi:hypothetical protein
VVQIGCYEFKILHKKFFPVYEILDSFRRLLSTWRRRFLLWMRASKVSRIPINVI